MLWNSAIALNGAAPRISLRGHVNYCYVLEKLDRKQEAAQSRAEAQVLLAFPEKRGLFP